MGVCIYIETFSISYSSITQLAESRTLRTSSWSLRASSTSRLHHFPATSGTDLSGRHPAILSHQRGIKAHDFSSVYSAWGLTPANWASGPGSLISFFTSCWKNSLNQTFRSFQNDVPPGVIRNAGTLLVWEFMNSAG
jgi:hypothetical protein